MTATGLKLTTVRAGKAEVELNGRAIGAVQRDSVAEQVRPGVVHERYGWAAIPARHVMVADPVRQAGCPVLPTRQKAAEWLAEHA